MDILSQVAETIKSICESENLIFKLNYRGRKFWENIGKNIESCFVDGGICNSTLPSSAPFAVRTKSYIINPSKSLTEREKFEETLSYMGDLYDVKNNLYDLTEDPYEDNQLITKKKKMLLESYLKFPQLLNMFMIKENSIIVFFMALYKLR